MSNAAKQEIIDLFNADIAKLEEARNSLSGVLLGNGYVVRCQGLTLGFTVDAAGNASKPVTVPLLQAPRYTKRDAETLAAATRNGNNVPGTAVHIVAAIDEALAEARRILAAIPA